MRILIIASFSGIGGAERSLMPLARELRAQGHVLTLFLARQPYDPSIFQEFAGTVDLPDAAHGQAARSPRRLWRLLRLVRRAEMVVATSELTVTYIAWLLATLCRRPLVADVQVHLSSWIRDNCHPAHRVLSRLIYPRVRALRSVSDGVSDDLQAVFHVRRERIAVIPVPFDLEEIRRESGRPLGARDEPVFARPVIVCAGRLTSQKRFDLAIRSFDLLVRGRGLDANLLILGEGEDRVALERQVLDLGLAGRVFLPGQVENIGAYMRRAAVFLLSSDYEGFGRVLVEALAVDCPCVSTDCPSGPAEILDGGRAGLLVPCGDVEGLASALAKVLTEPALAAEMRAAGSSRVEGFATGTVAQAYSRWLASVGTASTDEAGRVPA